MGRFHTAQPHDRSYGPPTGSPDDGLSSFGVYYGVVQSASSSGGTVRVVLPGLGPDHTYTAIYPHNLFPDVDTEGTDGGISAGDTVLVQFDDRKIPWVLAVA